MCEKSSGHFLACCSSLALSTSISSPIFSVSDEVITNCENQFKNIRLDYVSFCRFMHEMEGWKWLPHDQELAEWVGGLMEKSHAID